MSAIWLKTLRYTTVNSKIPSSIPTGSHCCQRCSHSSQLLSSNLQWITELQSGCRTICKLYSNHCQSLLHGSAQEAMKTPHLARNSPWGLVIIAGHNISHGCFVTEAAQRQESITAILGWATRLHAFILRCEIVGRIGTNQGLNWDSQSRQNCHGDGRRTLIMMVCQSAHFLSPAMLLTSTNRTG